MNESIDLVSAALLGAVQGATEFLPVSSSGHVALGALLLGQDETLTMTIMLHLGTLVATVALFWDDLLILLRSTLTGLREDASAWAASDEGRTVLGMVLSAIPTAIIGLSLKDSVEAGARIPIVLGCGFLGSALMVLLTRRGGGDQRAPTIVQALIIGAAQGLAVLPGLTRSGTTIACAMLLGLSGPAAFRFSFLMSLPAIAGATLLTLDDPEEIAGLGLAGLVGGVCAMVVGYVCLMWLRALVNQGRFWVFALYLVPLGLGLIGAQLAGVLP